MQNLETGQITGRRINPKLFWHVNRNSHELELFDMIIISIKTGNRTDNRTPDQPEILKDELVCIEIFSIGPTNTKIWTIWLMMGF